MHARIWVRALACLPRHTKLAAAVLAVVLLGACAQAQAPSEETASSPYVIELLAAEQGAGSLSVRLTGEDGSPLTDASVKLEGNMNHAGMVPVLTDPVPDDADGNADGVYVVPFEFTMLGDWIVTVSVEIDGEIVTRDFNLAVGVEGAELTGP